MKKVVLSLAVVALFGVIALSSCKSSSTPAVDSTKVETAVPAVDTAKAAVDTAAVKADTTVKK
jgi:hypothetical protein